MNLRSDKCGCDVTDEESTEHILTLATMIAAVMRSWSALPVGRQMCHLSLMTAAILAAQDVGVTLGMQEEDVSEDLLDMVGLVMRNYEEIIQIRSQTGVTH